MSRVKSIVKQKHRMLDSQVEYLEKIKEEKKQLLEKAFQEKRDIIYLTNEEINHIKNINVLEILISNILYREFIPQNMTFGKILAKILVKLYKLSFITREEVYGIFNDNFVDFEDTILFPFKTYHPLKLETKLILMNLIFKIRNSVEGENFFGIKTNFILGTGKKNVVLYGNKYANCSDEIIEIINKMKISDNINLIKIVNKAFQLNGITL